MVEAVFRQLKQKFIQHKPESKSDLIKSMVKFVEVYNFKIPHSSLIGGTPMEVFLGKWDSVKFAEDVLSQRRFRMLKRTKDYQLCTMCIQEQA
jgi:hypothetical protein